MTNKEMAIELLAQTLAPRLFKLFGTNPEDMGFPIYETKEEVEEHLARMGDPVGYWTEQGRKMAVSMINILEAGGAQLPELNYDAMLKASVKERPDMDGREDEVDAAIAKSPGTAQDGPAIP